MSSQEAPVPFHRTLEDRDATEHVVRRIHDNYDLDETPETNQNYRVALRVFGQSVTDENGEEPPVSIHWVNSTLPREYDASPDLNDMLRWEDDSSAMLGGCKNTHGGAR